MKEEKLIPGKPNECPGGQDGNGCLCDECDYLMSCSDVWEKEPFVYSKEEEKKGLKNIEELLKRLH